MKGYIKCPYFKKALKNTIDVTEFMKIIGGQNQDLDWLAFLSNLGCSVTQEAHVAQFLWK